VDVEKVCLSHVTDGNVKCHNHSGHTLEISLKNNQTQPLYNPLIAFLGIYPREMETFSH
jgi:hypothetical protein